MFKNGRKTIGIFINRAEQAQQHFFCRSIISQAEKYDYNIVFFAAYEIRESRSQEEVSETIIVDFAPVQHIDVCIVVLGSFAESSRANLMKSLKSRCKAPIISFKVMQNGVYNVLSGEDRGAGTLVRHLYSEHNARKICFFADKSAFRENLRRETFYRDSMEDCGLPVEESYLFQASGHGDRGEEAYAYFYESEKERPDAVICADDHLARELCNALIGHGIRIPEDTMVCGFNDSYESREFVPRLTAVSADIGEMAKETMKLADDLIQGRPRGAKITVPEQIFYRESCGCQQTDHRDIENYTREHYLMLDGIEESHVAQSFFNIFLDGCENFEEIKKTIGEHLYLLGDVDEFYLCLLGQMDGEHRIFSNEITERAQLELAFRNGEMISDQSISFLQQDLLPEEMRDQSKKIYYFSLLHNREKLFGYTVMNMKDPLARLNFFYYDWNMTVGLAINEYFSNMLLRSLLKKNEENSLTDFLTGMPNRRGLDRYVEEQWQRWGREGRKISFITMDLDGLKYINDHFGHEEGDWAISTIGGWAREILTPYGMISRTGGDEFVAVLEADEGTVKTLSQEIEERVEVLNGESGKDYSLGASIGHVTVTMTAECDFEQCVKASDAEMYKVKQAHKQGRK